MEKLTPPERIEKIIKYLGISIDAFGQKINKGNRSQAIYDIMDGTTKSITPNMKNKIIAVYPEINEVFLLTGTGEMLTTSEETEAYTNKSENSKETQEEAFYVPLLPVSAQGGNLDGFVSSIESRDCEQIISPIKGIELALTIAGDSMAPEYPSGAKILVKKINEKAFIDWGRVYVLDTCNGIVIKKIFPTDDNDPEKVKCVSINPEYPPFEVYGEDIYGMYRVILCMSIK